MTSFMARTAVALGAALILVAIPATSHAGAYPVNKCVSAKMKAAGKYCQGALQAWSKWAKTPDDAKRDAALDKAQAKLDAAWPKAEAKAAGTDCNETTASPAAIGLVAGSTAAAIAAEMGPTIEAGGGDSAAGLLKAAAKMCSGYLKAESKLIAGLDKDPQAEKRAAAQAKVRSKFSQAWAKSAGTGGGAADLESLVAGLIEDVNDLIVTDTTVSPNVDNSQFTTLTPDGGIDYEGRTLNPICSGDTPYHFFVKRGSVNKLLMYYQGGGACWDFFTCDLPVFKTAVDPEDDDPNNFSTGFADFSNPENPFKDWNVVFVPYCTGDIHWGDAEQTYTSGSNSVTIQHRGFINAKVAEKWAREHFVNPEQIFVSGSSAGAYGALLHGVLLHEVYPASDFAVMPDAGNGVITQEFLETNFPSWNVEPNLPSYIPEFNTPIAELSIPEVTAAAANYYPQTRWAHYSTAYDGGTGGQTGFYNVMLNPGNVFQWLRWWDASCEWNSIMREQVAQTVALAPSNYRYYIGTGSRHTVWGSDKIYTDTTGGVPRLIDWVNSMLDNDAGWTNVECTNCGLLLDDDTRPNPLEPPFEQVGDDVVISCP